MKLSFAEVGLESLDALSELDAACLFLFEDERPLRGAAGYIDWRLCGALSRVLGGGRFVGALGDALLFPTGGRLCFSRIFCFGAGRRQLLSRASFAILAKRACSAMSLAGSRGVATELPSIAADDSERARSFLEGTASFKGDRIVVLSSDRSLTRAFRQVLEQFRGIEMDKDLLVTAQAATHRTSRGRRAARAT
jgi:hypothetical protein